MPYLRLSTLIVNTKAKRPPLTPETQRLVEKYFPVDIFFQIRKYKHLLPTEKIKSSSMRAGRKAIHNRKGGEGA